MINTLTYSDPAFFQPVLGQSEASCWPLLLLLLLLFFLLFSSSSVPPLATWLCCAPPTGGRVPPLFPTLRETLNYKPERWDRGFVSHPPKTATFGWNSDTDAYGNLKESGKKTTTRRKNTKKADGCLQHLSLRISSSPLQKTPGSPTLNISPVVVFYPSCSREALFVFCLFEGVPTPFLTRWKESGGDPESWPDVVVFVSPTQAADHRVKKTGNY